MTDEEMKKIIEDRKKKFEEAISHLKGTGIPVEFQASSGRYKAISDSIEVECENDNVKLLVDGTDITKYISSVNISITPGNYPVVLVVFNPHININDVPERPINVFQPRNTKAVKRQ